MFRRKQMQLMREQEYADDPLFLPPLTKLIEDQSIHKVLKIYSYQKIGKHFSTGYILIKR